MNAAEDEKPLLNWPMNPPKNVNRKTCYLVVVCLGLSRLVSHWLRVFPAAIEKQLEDGFSLSAIEYNELNAIYVLPSIFTSFLCGHLISFLGGEISLLLFSTCVAIGQFIFTLGLQARSVPLMLFGRFAGGAFWMGIDSIKIPLLGKYFTSSFAFPMALTDAMARVGIFLSFWLSAEMSEKHSITKTSFITCFWGLAGVNGALVLFLYTFNSLSFTFLSKFTVCTRRYDKLEIEVDASDTQPPPKSDVQLHDGIVLNEATNVVHYDRDLRSEETSEAAVISPRVAEAPRKFSFNFWLLNLIIAVLYMSTPSLLLIGSELIQEHWHLSFENSNLDISIVEDSVIFLGPLLGIFLDSYDGREKVLISGATLISFIHLLLYLRMNLNVYFVMCLLGLGWTCVYVTCWSLLPSTIHEDDRGVASGIAGSAQNVGMFLGSQLLGFIDEYSSEHTLFLYFFSISITAVILSVWFLKRKTSDIVVIDVE